GRHLNAERSRRLNVDDEFKSGGLHDRQVCGLCALEDEARVDADLVKHIQKDSSVAHQPTDSCEITYRIDSRYPVASSQGGKLHGATNERCIGSYQEGIGAFPRNGAKGRVDPVGCRGVEYLSFQPDGECGVLRVAYSCCGD